MLLHGKEIMEIAKEEDRKEQRLLNYAESFNGLSEAFVKMSAGQEKASEEEIGQVQNEITGKICVSCDMCQVCWEKDSPIYGLFGSLMESIEKFGRAEKEYEDRLRDCCPYADDITREAVRIFERMKVNAAWYNRLLSNREMIAQQLDAMAFIMEDCAKDYEDLTLQEKNMLSQVRFLAKDRGFLISNIHLYQKQNGRLQLVTTVRTKAGCQPVKEYREAVSRGMGKTMIQHKDSRNLIGIEPCKIVFEEDTKYHTIHGVARLTKDEAVVSGDNFSFLELENGQDILCLSDGMGSGIDACKESETVIELMEKFLEAGFSKETAILKEEKTIPYENMIIKEIQYSIYKDKYEMTYIKRFIFRDNYIYQISIGGRTRHMSVIQNEMETFFNSISFHDPTEKINEVQN